MADGNGAAHLKKYWLTGEGAAKIRWNTDGDFTRCVKQLTPHLDGNLDFAKRYCAELHFAATSMWPGDRRNQ